MFDKPLVLKPSIEQLMVITSLNLTCIFKCFRQTFGFEIINFEHALNNIRNVVDLKKNGRIKALL